ncbi:prolyl oligopeptidase family protein [Mycobacteroides abscessus]|nr:osmotically inducible protein C [Mycobacterium kansasii]MBE5406171.1 hypothetical protein [Mycobacteroides abscessus]SIH40735.1 prolyl oligopeptidase family protein [Mycobacteroides abscessus subsp. abscessus]SIM55780.1 OsmC family protein [Mycobacteroides abscessus subsp. bolletii]SLB65051.1 prolyl oligopeptidase family protein [Mycobacteroides abscessus subsp. massiliense]
MCRVCWQADPEWKDKYCVRRAYDPAHRELDTAGGLTHPASSSDEEVVPMSNSERVTFAGSSGSLSGRLETPEQPPTTWAVFAHCFTCGKDNSAAARISRALTGSGIGVLRFDFTGLGDSEGDFAATGFSSNVDDLVCAADFMRASHGAPTMLIGHSLGGAAVLAAASRINDVNAIAVIGTPADPGHVAGLLRQSRDDIAAGEATISIAGREFRLQRQFLDDIAAQPQRERIRAADAALLVLHSPTDQVVSVDNAREIFDIARHPKSFVALDGADHLLSCRDDAEYAATVIAAWAGRYLKHHASTALTRSGPPPSDDGVVRVAERGDAGSLTQDITVGSHRLVADEPRPISDDMGPTPYDLLLAALGACTSMTIRMYAERKRWPLESVVVDARHSRVHAQDCAELDKTKGFIDRIERHIMLQGPLSAIQRDRLMEIASRCPVHRTLRSEVDIRTTGRLRDSNHSQLSPASSIIGDR